MTPRHLATKALLDVVQQQKSLSAVLPERLSVCSPQDQALLQAMVYGVCRHYHYLKQVLSELLHKDLPKEQQTVEVILLLGIYQLLCMRIPDHAAVSETVNVTRAMKVDKFSKLVNGVLRNAQRQKDKLLQQFPIDQDQRHPSWLAKRVQRAWPEQADEILLQNNQHPPMHLRVNVGKVSAKEYMQQLHDAGITASLVDGLPSAITLHQPVDVSQLPGFAEGWVSVQDVAAQYAAELLDCQSGDVVLDACAAPGGKTAHILERHPDLKLYALDIEQARLDKVQQTLDRLDLQAELVCQDALTWHSPCQFDRILLDAPCSATGVIRRHPDIKLLRRADDITILADTQLRLLQTLWTHLKPGGVLLYATCSILPQENDDVIAAFLAQESRAELRLPQLATGFQTQYGCQLVPKKMGPDGFYYARLAKAR